MKYFVELCLGLQHAHMKKIVHKELKPENILVGEGALLKIGDFGINSIVNKHSDIIV